MAIHVVERTTGPAEMFPQGRMRAVTGGVVAGLVGGAVLAIILVIKNLATGQDGWLVTKFAALPFVGLERVTHPGFDAGPVILGVLSHFAVSVFWGALFGGVFYGLGKGATVFAGAIWGVIVWLGMYHVVLPLIGAGEIARSVPVAAALLEHIAFGLTIGLAFLPYQRPRMHGGEPPRTYAGRPTYGDRPSR